MLVGRQAMRAGYLCLFTYVNSHRAPLQPAVSAQGPF